MLEHQVDWQTIAAHISNAAGLYFEVQTIYSITGGSTNVSFRLEGKGQNYFVKVNRRECFDMFAAEAAGLAELAQPAVIKVPMPLCWGTTPHHSYLVMEYLTLRNDMTESIQVLLGQHLAVMHQVSRFPFGWYRYNYLGLTPQINTLETDWITFWRNHRLGYQLSLAARNGYGGELQRRGEQLLVDLDLFFSNYQPYSSLLHGDLEACNWAIDVHGQPVIYDPAMYYGDREIDLAVTEFFGGFSENFYRAYQEQWPLDPGYSVRKNLYKLYHVLNHLNLFGGAYLGQAERMMLSLLSEL